MAVVQDISTRIIQKHDTTEQWEQSNTFIPRKGEIIAYDAEYGDDGAQLQPPRLKIGDGNTLIGAGDVSNIENIMPQKGGTLAVVGDIPTKVSELTNDSGYTTNKGTVTQVKVNNETKTPDASGLVDLGTISGGGDAIDAVKYTPQTLTAAQKTQARSNIGAGTGNGTVTGVKINGSTKGTSGVVDLGYIQVKLNGTTYTADSNGFIDLGTISGGGTTTYNSTGNNIY